jgi:N-acyl-D-aspartate/D-glutamate deacylase
MDKSDKTYDLVIQDGRVIDPESNRDTVCNVGIIGRVIQALSKEKLEGQTILDARNLIVSPGFIDLNSHGQTDENYRCQAMDGVTTALALEIGTSEVDLWYQERENKVIINYGVNVGHVPVRMNVMKDAGTFLPVGDGGKREATSSEIEAMKEQIEMGLKQGAVAVGFGIQYTPNASAWEILEMFRVAAKYEALCYVHLRNQGEVGKNNSISALEEVIAAVAITGASLQVTHIQSIGGQAVLKLLQMIAEAKARGVNIGVDFYPYTAGLTFIESSFFDEGWQAKMGIDYQNLQWADTGEQLNAESFKHYREIGGPVIIHIVPDGVLESIVANPIIMVATDGYLRDGKGHPRTAGTYTRMLSQYVRETGVLTWMECIRKMTLMPAQRIEERVQSMKKKGRISVGCDADITIFDPKTVKDQSTYEEPSRYSKGVKHVLVGGEFVVWEGQLQEDKFPGIAIRAL